jgi:hypothetical protein
MLEADARHKARWAAEREQWMQKQAEKMKKFAVQEEAMLPAYMIRCEDMIRRAARNGAWRTYFQESPRRDWGIEDPSDCPPIEVSRVALAAEQLEERGFKTSFASVFSPTAGQIYHLAVDWSQEGSYG